MSNANDFVIKNGVLTGYTGPGGDVVVPAGVTKIVPERSWLGIFKGDSGITSVTLPEGLEEIGTGAFFGCKELEQIHFPESLKIIGANAFFRCTKLSNVLLPPNLEKIGASAFGICEEFTEIVIPQTVKEIGSSAFAECKNVKRLELPQSGVEIGESAFRGCPGLADRDGFVIIRGVLYSYHGEATELVIPNTVHTVSGFAFMDKTNIASIKIPDSVTLIGEAAFKNLNTLKEIRLPGGLKVLGGQAFRGWSSLEEISFPDSLERIGGYAFGDCQKLKGIKLPKNLASIGPGAFEGCSEIRHVVIPASLRERLVCDEWNQTFPEETLTIAERKLTAVGQIPKAPCWDGGNVLFTVADGDRVLCKLLLTSKFDKLFDKKGNFDWQQYDLLLVNNGPKIKLNAAFRTMAMVYRLRYPYKLEESIKSAYVEHICKNIKRITPYANCQPEDGLVQLLEDIGAITAKNKKILLPLMGIGEAPAPKAKTQKAETSDGVKTPAQIKKEWTYKKLEDGTIRLNSYKGEEIDVVVPDMVGKDKVTVIGEYCLSAGSYKASENQCEHRKKIRSVVVPEGVAIIEERAFASCPSLETVSLPKSVVEVGNGAFFNCPVLKSVEVPETAKIDSTAFKSCNALVDAEGFIVKNGILFAYYGTAEVVNVPAGVKRIAVTAMMGNAHIVEIVLPEGVKSIEENVFYNCKALKKIHIPASVEEIDNNQWDWSLKPEIHGLTGSYAEEYARNGHWRFVSTGVTEKKNVSNFVIWDGELTEYRGSDEEVIIPEGVITIGTHQNKSGWGEAGAFEENKALKKVVIPAGVREIKSGAFEGCTNLKYVEIPDSVIQVGPGAFLNTLWEQERNGQMVYIGKILYKAGSCEKELVVREGTVAVEAQAFYGNRAIEKVTLPEGLKRIGGGAFYGCNNLESMVVPSSVEELGDYLFTEGQKLKQVSGGVLRRTTKMSAKFKMFYTGDPEDTAWLVLYQPEKSWQKAAREALTADTASVGATMKQIAVLIRGLEILDKAVGNRVAAFAQEWCKFAGKDALQAVYDALKEKNHPMVKKLDTDTVFQQCLQGPAEEDVSELHPVEAMVVENLTPSPLYEKVLQQIFTGVRYAGSEEACAPRVLAYIVTEYVKQYDPEMVRYISEYAYSCGSIHSSDVADKAAKTLDQEDFLDALQRLAERNEESYWIPYARYADEKRTVTMISQMRAWDNWNAFAATGRKNIIIARTGLLLNDTRAAMLYFDKIGQLHKYAEIRGTDAETLRDTVLSEFGFDKNREIWYDLGGNTLLVQMGDDLSLTLFDTNAGKTVKSIPKKNADPALYDQAKAAVSDLKKNIKKVVTNRKNTLFADFLSGGEKDAETWKRSYFGNPVLNSVARLLVWTQEGKTFTVTAEGAVDSRGAVYEISGAPIRVAHPMEMQEEISAWQSYFTDRGLKQPFEQVWEPAYKLEDIHEDRYSGCKIPVYRLTNKEQHGITVWGLTAYSECYGFNLKDCELEHTASEWRFIPGITDDATFELGKLQVKNMTRYTNHILYLFDKWTVADRILKDDISIEASLAAFTAAQIREFLTLANENGCTNCAALLLNYQNENFAEFDPMAEFTLDL